MISKLKKKLGLRDLYESVTALEELPKHLYILVP